MLKYMAMSFASLITLAPQFSFNKIYIGPITLSLSYVKVFH